MAPLKSLESEYPIIDSDFRQFCASHAIFSVEDFLVHDIYVLMALAEEHDTSDRLKQAITQVLSIIDAQHQPWLDGLQLLGYSQKSKSILSTGCERIDAFLRGGFQEGILTELVGPSSSGKTQVCLLAASNVTKSGLGRVLFLDTGNSFSPTRVAQFVSSSSELADTELEGSGEWRDQRHERSEVHTLVVRGRGVMTVTKEGMMTILKLVSGGCMFQSSKILPQVLDNIECRSVFDIFTLLDVLHQLLQNLRYQVGQNLRMLIIDSVSSLITPVLGGAGTHGHALMASAGFMLKKLAYEYNLSVLMTNHMVAGDGGMIKPALGESWKSIPHIRLLLSRDVLNNICSMSILRHPSMAIGERVEFAIL